jgi:hypothetical protein
VRFRSGSVKGDKFRAFPFTNRTGKSSPPIVKRSIFCLVPAKYTARTCLSTYLVPHNYTEIGRVTIPAAYALQSWLQRLPLMFNPEE